jgi:hypothetical protein
MLPRLRAAATSAGAAGSSRGWRAASVVVSASRRLVHHPHPRAPLWRALHSADVIAASSPRQRASAFASSVTALGSTRQLGFLNVSAWGAVAVAVIAAVFGSRWGLVGLVYGVGLGWLAHAIAAACLAIPHLGDPPEIRPGAGGPA